MKSSKILSLAVAAALGLVSTSAISAVDVSKTTGQGDPVYYASETTFEGTTSIAVPGSELAFSPNYKIEKDGVFYARIDLEGAKLYHATSGTKWADNALDTTAVGTGAAGTNAITLLEGGTIGSTYAIYTVKAGTAVGDNIPSDAVFTLSMNSNGMSIQPTTGSLNVTARVRLYNNSAQAQNPENINSITVKDYKGTIFAMKAAVVLGTESATSTALVAKEYKELNDATGQPAGTTKTKAKIGTFALYHTGAINTFTGGTNVAVYDKTGSAINSVSANAAAGAALYAAETTVTVKGDFSLVKKADGTADKTMLIMYQNAGDGTIGGEDCTGDATILTTDSVAADFQSATFKFPLAPINGEYTLCYDFATNAKATAIPESTYTFDLAAKAVTGYTTTALNKSGELGKIKRDGVVLRAAFASRSPLAVSRFIFANTGTSDANITAVKLYANNNGSTTQPTMALTLPYTLKAGSRTAIQLSEVVAAAAPGDTTTNSLAAVEFYIGTQDDNIFGTYQMTMGGANVFTIVPLERPVSTFKQ